MYGRFMKMVVVVMIVAVYFGTVVYVKDGLFLYRQGFFVCPIGFLLTHSWWEDSIN